MISILNPNYPKRQLSWEKRRHFFILSAGPKGQGSPGRLHALVETLIVPQVLCSFENLNMKNIALGYLKHKL